jgi:hypothetical protein
MTNLFTKYNFTPEQKKTTQERAIALIKFLNEVTHEGINNHKQYQQTTKLKLIQKKGGFYAVR